MLLRDWPSKLWTPPSFTKLVTEPINLFHIADIHIGMENYGRLDAQSGLNSRVLDFIRRFSQAIDLAIEREADVCIFAGDAYKNQRPTPTLQREFARRIRRLSEANIPTILLVGNHDMAVADRAASSIDIFGVFDIPGVTVASREAVHQITCRRGQPLQVATLPYPQRGRLLAQEDHKNLTLDELDQRLKALLNKNITDLAYEVQEQPDIPAVLTAHISLGEATTGSEQGVMIGRDITVARGTLTNSTWDYVALGHIHKHQELNGGNHPPIVYPGSLERIDFGEEGERKGFVMATIEKGRCTWAFIPVDSRPFVTIRVDVTQSLDPMTQILETIPKRSVDGAVVRLVIKATAEQEPLLDDRAMRRALKAADYIASISRDIERPNRQRIGEVATEELSPQEALGLYFEAKKISPERRETLLSYAESIFEEE